MFERGNMDTLLRNATEIQKLEMAKISFAEGTWVIFLLFLLSSLLAVFCNYLNGKVKGDQVRLH